MKTTILYILPGFFLLTHSPCLSQSLSLSADPSSFSIQNTSGIGWNSINNSQMSDDQRTYSGYMFGIFPSSINTDILKTENYGFAVPSSAVVCGIEVTLEKRGTGILLGTNIRDNSLYLMKSGTAVGTNKANTTNWGGSDAVMVYGGPSDLWGTAWTPAEINASDFGCMFAARMGSGIAGVFLNAEVDHIRITVYYTVSPLSVSLLFFDAFLEETGTVKLNWITETEENNDYFAIQRSADASSWEEIGRVNGFGNSNQPQNYECSDDEVSPGTWYYRLKQVDHNGSNNYHQILSVIIPSSRHEILASPNPACDHIIFNCSGEEADLLISLYDIRGNKVKQTKEYRLKKHADNSVNMEIPDLKKGLYFYKAIIGSEVLSGSIIKE